jgi:hypothetical protein
MRTCVRMGPPRYRPVRELERAIERRELDLACALARELTRSTGRPLDLGLALGLVGLVAADGADAFDPWALRWLSRWIAQSRHATIETAAEIAGSLADLPAEPRLALESIRRNGRLA